MKINQFSQIGKRSNNEDSLGYSMGLLTVCDGMGGHKYGERAANFVKEKMLKAFAVPQPIGKMEIQQQLNQVQIEINQIIESEPDFDRMGTTFTGVFITPDVWYAAHIGDSRIYLFRPLERKLWHTWDHSVVGDMMRTKEISVEAGRNHPQSNRISRAIMAQKDAKPTNASIVKIDQLKAGDILLLCSDGVVESWSDLELVKLFSDDSLSFDEKCKRLSDVCELKSSDNNTAIIAEIEGDDAIDFGNNAELDWTTFDEVQADYDRYLSDRQKAQEQSAVNTGVTTPPTTQVTHGKQPLTPKKGKRTISIPSGIKTKGFDNPIVKWAVLAAIVIVVAVVVILLTRSSKPVDDFDSNSTEVDYYRTYIRQNGKKGKHYDEAQHFVDSFVADSIQKAQAEKEANDLKIKQEQERQKQKEIEKKEDNAYQKCTTIDACDQYLKNYPNGRYVNKVKAKKTELEKKQKKSNPRLEQIEGSIREQPYNEPIIPNGSK